MAFEYFIRDPAVVKLGISQTKVKKLLEMICHPAWYKQAPGFEEAKLVARTNNQIILLALTDNNCPNAGCSKLLEKAVFSTCEFGFWAGKNGVLLVNVDALSTEQKMPDGSIHCIWLFSMADAAIFTHFKNELPDDEKLRYVPLVFGLAPDGQILGWIHENKCGKAGVNSWIQEFEEITNMQKSKA